MANPQHVAQLVSPVLETFGRLDIEGTRATTNLDPAYQEQARMGALLRRAADKDDIAEQVVAFCRTDSITGQTLAIDAGSFFH